MLSNWTKATTTTTGTGDITLASVSGYPLPSGVFPTSAFVPYSIQTSDGKFESGIGTLGATNTLTRTRVNSTFDGTTYNNTTATALTLAAGTHNVYIGPMAETLFNAPQFPSTLQTTPNILSAHLTQGQANVSASPAAVGRAYAWPFLLLAGGLLTALTCNVATAQAGTTLILAVHESDLNGWPGRQLAKTSTAIDTSTTGFKSQSVAANVMLPPGIYWIASCVPSGTAPTVTGSNGQCMPMIGSNGVSAISGVRADTAVTDIADPFPTTSPVFLTFTTQGAPLFGMQLS